MPPSAPGAKKVTPPPSPEEFLKRYPPHVQGLAEGLRQLVKQTIPGCKEAVVLGWGLIGYRLDDGKKGIYFAFVAPRPDCAFLGFEHGVGLPDPHGLLKGEGTQVRQVPVRAPDDLRHDALAPLIRAAADAARARRGAR